MSFTIGISVPNGDLDKLLVKFKTKTISNTIPVGTKIARDLFFKALPLILSAKTNDVDEILNNIEVKIK